MIEDNLLSINELLLQYEIAEEEYKSFKSEVDKKFMSLLIFTNWDEINNGRKSEGLSKLSNQDMKNAFIKLQLDDLYLELQKLQLRYNNLKRIYEMCLRFGVLL